ncbi:CHAT domain-containing protein [Streptomyces rhizosphaerihabitans]|uniref:CHAT domain-containing protein n=1 Tax=Streptomyces rhizosphaerihabitans TaxID=1266770 RepID=UPI0021BFF812|nr:CHAT domain-containing protein [Streptomyces rhizosphaerihabitans]MCT9003519.1 CHAT domain-containing protein [Streptomyces rhizosphaerihabitans]
MPVDEDTYDDFYRRGVRAVGREQYAEAFYWFSRAHAAGHPEAADLIYQLLHTAGEPGDPFVVWQPTTEPVALYAAAARAYREFTATGDLDLLDRSVALNWESVRSAPPGLPARTLMLASLRDVLRDRYDQRGRLTDLTEALGVAHEALDVLPGGHCARLKATQLLIALERARYEAIGDADSLRTAVEGIGRPALAQSGGAPGDRAALESSLCGALSSLARHTDEVPLLDEAVDLGRDAVGRTTAAGPDVVSRNNLATALIARGTRRGSLDDLNSAIEVLRAAPAADDAQRASEVATTLMAALRARAELTGRAADERDAKAAEEYLKETLRRAPTGHPNRRVQEAAVAHGEAGVEAARRALDALPPAHVERPFVAARLAQALADAGQRSEAVEVVRKAAALVTGGRAAVDANRVLGKLLMGADEHGVVVHEGEMLDAFTTAAEACAKTDYVYAEVKTGQAVALLDRFHHGEDASDRQEAVAALRAAAEADGSSVQDRLFAARCWAGIAMEAGDRADALVAARAAVTLLREFGWAGLDRDDQVQSIQDGKAMPREAAALAIDTGQPELAVELLEQGRSVLWTSTLHLRGDLAALAAHDPARAAELEQVRATLNEKDRLGEEERLRLARRWQQLVREVRESEEFAGFLGPPAFDELAPAAAEGPVVIVNISTIRCDAILVLPGGKTDVVKLPGVDVPGIDTVANTYLHALAAAAEPGATFLVREDARHTVHDTLEWLWDHIARPVLDRLAWPTESTDPPRLWWCPTASLTVLPLHAAGRYPRAADDPTEPVGLPYAAVSSYTTTLSALVDARQRAAAVDPTLLAVALTDTERGHAVLPGVAEELRALDEILGRRRLTVLAEDEATSAAVRRQLPAHPWAHFACHGWLDMTAPASSGLCLRDGDLNLLDIADLRLDTADLAFLSACQTRLDAGQLPDEAVHTAAALRIAGFRHVVATLWSISDQAALQVAAAFYRRLDGSDGPNSADAARALHHAVGELRARHPTDPTLWVPFVHDGP